MSTSSEGIAVSAQWQFAGWYYHQGQQRIGPVPTEEIVRLLNTSVLRPEDEVLVVWTAATQRRVFRSRAIAALDFASN